MQKENEDLKQKIVDQDAKIIHLEERLSNQEKELAQQRRLANLIQPPASWGTF